MSCVVFFHEVLGSTPGRGILFLGDPYFLLWAQLPSCGSKHVQMIIRQLRHCIRRDRGSIKICGSKTAILC